MKYIEVLEGVPRAQGREEPAADAAPRRADTWADDEDLVADVGYRPSTPVEIGVRRFVDWFVDYHKVKR
jgi:UDP-glucuronate 4-epimerase